MNNFLSIANLENLKEKSPDSLIFAFLASRYLEQGNVDKAIEILETGLKKFPDYAFGHFIMGMCYYQLKDLPKAKAHLEIATGYDEKNPRAWKILGEINEQLDLPMQAEECYQKFYLLDQFSEEAVRKIQKGEILEFDAFSEPDTTQTAPPAETFTEEEKKETEIEQNLEELLEESGDESQLKKEISEEVDEVFKETLGTLPEEIELSAEEETGTSETEVPGGEKETQTSESAETEENKFASEFIDMLEADEQESIEGTPPSAETTEKEAGTVEEVIPPEEAPSEEAEVESSKEPETEEKPPEEEELMDFSSVVEDIISEREGELTEKEPPEEDQSGTTMTIIREEGEARETLAEAEAPPPAEEKEESTTRFGKPPILSPTLGEIYIAQGRFQEALEVFKQLLEKEPENQRIQRKIKDIENLIRMKESEESEESEE